MKKSAKLLTVFLLSFLLTNYISASKNFINRGETKMEKEKIVETITNFFADVDARNWEKVKNALAENVLLDYTSMAGGEPATLTPQQIADAWKGLLPGFQSTHHQIGNFTTDVKENKADVKFHGLALHYLPNESNDNVWVVVGTYDYNLSKNENGNWLIDKIKFNFQMQEGNTKLPELAQKNVVEGVIFNLTEVTKEAEEAVKEFFTSLENMDIQSFIKVWADDGKQIMPLSPENFPKELNGKDTIYNQYKGLPENFHSMKFPKKIFATHKPNLVIVNYRGLIPMKSGGDYNNNYVGLFEINNGKVQQFTEYFDPFILADAFGINLQSSFNVSSSEKTQKVEFESNGLILVGKLHLPEDFTEENIYKGIVVTGSWTTVKEQMPDHYAAKLAKDGFVVLTFDFRNYGESEGQPRNFESPELKSQDIINAVNYLQSLPFIEKENIGGLAVCASAGYMSTALANGAKMKAVNFVAPWLHNSEIVKAIYGGEEGVNNLISKANNAKQKFAETGEVDYVIAASDKDNTAAMFGPFDYYLNPERGAIEEWGNQFALMAWKGWLEFDPIKVADKIQTPIQIIHSQTAAVPQGTELFYDKLQSAKNIIWIEGASQFDFYDQDNYTSNATKESAKWFDLHLK